MKKASYTDSFSIRYGRIRLDEHNAREGYYKTGYYVHPLGIVTIYLEDDTLTIRASNNGREYIRWITQKMSDRQIGNFCRKLLIEIQK